MHSVLIILYATIMAIAITNAFKTKLPAGSQWYVGAIVFFLLIKLFA